MVSCNAEQKKKFLAADALVPCGTRASAVKKLSKKIITQNGAQQHYVYIWQGHFIRKSHQCLVKYEYCYAWHKYKPQRSSEGHASGTAHSYCGMSADFWYKIYCLETSQTKHFSTQNHLSWEETDFSKPPSSRSRIDEKEVQRMKNGRTNKTYLNNHVWYSKRLSKCIFHLVKHKQYSQCLK